MGYAGGTLKNPTYHNLGDHTETTQIDFDPEKIGYEKLLEMFFTSHSCGRAYSRQYMSAIFYHNDEQKKLAQEALQRHALKRGKLATLILPYTEFYMAEDYHQKYMLQQDAELMKEFSAMYPRLRDLVHSTSAARANGCLGGNGAAAELKTELSEWGLSDAAGKKLLARRK